MSATILFFGNERLATGIKTDARLLRALLEANYTIAAVIVAQNPRTTRDLEVAHVAEQHQIPLLTPVKLSAIREQLLSFGATAAVLAAYGKLVPASVIDIFPRGIINIHPSLLPKHRGSTPIESVILDGDQETGVSLMKLAPEMDAGPLFAQEKLTLTGNESKQTLADMLASLGKDMLIKHLPAILDGSLEAAPQTTEGVSYDHLITKDDGLLNAEAWRQPAKAIERKVRAYAGWPRVKTTLGAIEAVLTEVHVTPLDGTPGSIWREKKQLGIHTSQGTLVIDRLVPAGKREMTAEAFLAGYKL